MAFGPTSVDSGYARGIEGAPFGLNVHTGYIDKNPIADENSLCRVGSFVWQTDTEMGYGYIKASATPPTATSRPLGFVRRTLVYSSWGWTLSGGGSLLVPDGETLAVATAGSFWARSLTDAEVGQAVYAMTNPTDVSDTPRITTAAPGETIANAIETPWRVLEGGDAEALIVIQNRLES